MTDTRKETNRVIRTKYSVLTILSGRTLPSLASDLKAASLLKNYYRTPYEVTEAAREKLVKELPAGWDSPQFPADLAARWQAEVLDATQDIPVVPDRLKLTKDDLPQPPKLKKGEDESERSLANRQGVADLVVALGDLFRDEGA